MGAEKICGNAECLARFEPNTRGATKDYCPRCVMWMRRHEGQLPGPKRERVPTKKHTVVLPADFEDRLSALEDEHVATWVRRVAEEALDELEVRRGRR